ncbi:MAG: hypothetical protein D6765_01730 [Bacteroidetes bacterium]|nr:MAG: hypothetical protein D6765_01730 [Bacteroidota bacterium]
MECKKWLILSLLVFGSQILFAQTSSNAPSDQHSLLGLSSDSWSFYMDHENKVLFIDFETIPVNLSEVVIRNREGKVVWKDELWNLPVNSIYEVNLKPFPAGDYEVELKSFTGSMVKDLRLR